MIDFKWILGLEYVYTKNSNGREWKSFIQKHKSVSGRFMKKIWSTWDVSCVTIKNKALKLDAHYMRHK